MYSAILFPVDIEHEGSWGKSLPTVIKFAEAFGSTVHVLNVVNEVRGTMSSEFLPADFEESTVKRAKENLAKFVASNLGGLSKVESHIETGRPYKEIVEAADRLNCDLVIMGSHKPDMIDLLIGPNADNVVRHSKKSVLVVRD